MFLRVSKPSRIRIIGKIEKLNLENQTMLKTRLRKLIKLKKAKHSQNLKNWRDKRKNPLNNNQRKYQIKSRKRLKSKKALLYKPNLMIKDKRATTKKDNLINPKTKPNKLKSHSQRKLNNPRNFKQIKVRIRRERKGRKMKKHKRSRRRSKIRSRLNSHPKKMMMMAGSQFQLKREESIDCVLFKLLSNFILTFFKRIYSKNFEYIC